MSIGRESARRQTGQSKPRLSLPSRRQRPRAERPPIPPLGIRPLPSPSIDQRGETRLRLRHCPSPVPWGVTPFRPRKLWRFSSASGQGRAVFQIIHHPAEKRLPRIEQEGRQRDGTGISSRRIADPQNAS